MAHPIKVTDRNKRHNKRCSASRKETLERRKLREYFLVVTNSSGTELRYFERIARKLPRNSLAQMKVDFRNKDPRDLVEHVLEEADQRNFQHVAAVFDKDDFVHFDNAVSKMKAAARHVKGVSLYTAYSNECFELWMLLHFQDVNASLDRERLFDKLQHHVQDTIGAKYRYERASFPFELLENPGDQREAIRRANNMLTEAKHRNPKNPWSINPTTEVHVLIEKLEEFMIYT